MDAVREAQIIFLSDAEPTVVVIIGQTGAGRSAEKWARRAQELAATIASPGLYFSLAAQEIARDLIDSEMRFQEIGVYPGTDQFRSERIFAAVAPDLPAPPARIHAHGNVPPLGKSFIGRFSESEQLAALILDRPLITVVGPTGVGKTALALHVVRSASDAFPDGVWRFEADRHASGDALFAEMARAFAIAGIAGSSRLASVLSGRQALVLIDSAEHLFHDVHELAQLLAGSASAATLLLTSTRPLGAPTEFLFRLGPMSLPRKDDVPDWVGSDAIRLFLERASQRGYELGSTNEQLEAVAEVCQAVDGLPLGIELLVGSLSSGTVAAVRQLAARQDTIQLAKEPGRHASVGSAMADSFSTLSNSERTLLTKLSWFAKGWSISAVEATAGQPVSRGDLERLADKSWLQFGGETLEFSMLSTIRTFLRAQAPQQEEPFRRAVACYFISRATQINTDAGAFIDLDGHYADAVEALQYLMKSPALVEERDKLFQGLQPYWLYRNVLDDANRLSQQLLRLPMSPLTSARAHTMRGVVLLRHRKHAEALEEFSQVKRLSEVSQSVAGTASALANIGTCHSELGKHVAAWSAFNEALDLLRSKGSPEQLGNVLCNAADDRLLAATSTRSTYAREQSIAEAEALLHEFDGLSISSPIVRQAALCNWGSLCCLREEWESAKTAYLASLEICIEYRFRHEALDAVKGLAAIAIAQQSFVSAAKLLGLAIAIQRDAHRTPTERELRETGAMLQSLTTVLGDHHARSLQKYGASLELVEISDYALK